MTDPVHDREAAWTLLCTYTKSEALRRHALAVEAAVRGYAEQAAEDADAWGNVALLHDFDYEVHPTLDRHPEDGAPILRHSGYPEWFVRAVLSHAEHLGLERESRLERTLFACDELAGFVHACGLVRPDGLATLEPASVRKKLKQKSFAAGVNRDDVYRGAELLGIDLDQHIRNVIAALRPVAVQLGLRG
jgi:predicted hydrolase (HD superfamily)